MEVDLLKAIVATNVDKIFAAIRSGANPCKLICIEGMYTTSLAIALETGNAEIIYAVTTTSHRSTVNKQGVDFWRKTPYNVDTFFVEEFLQKCPPQLLDRVMDLGLNADFALYFAMFTKTGCDINLMKHTLRSGADPNGIVFGKTMLMHAVRAGTLAVDYLLCVGADPNLSLEDGDHCLLLIARQNLSPTLVHLFKEREVDLNKRDKHGNTAIMYAAAMKNIDLMEALSGLEIVNVTVKVEIV